MFFAVFSKPKLHSESLKQYKKMFLNHFLIFLVSNMKHTYSGTLFSQWSLVNNTLQCKYTQGPVPNLISKFPVCPETLNGHSISRLITKRRLVFIVQCTM